MVLTRRYSISFKGKRALDSAARFLGPTGQPASPCHSCRQPLTQSFLSNAEDVPLLSSKDQICFMLLAMVCFQTAAAEQHVVPLRCCVLQSYLAKQKRSTGKAPADLGKRLQGC